MARYRLKRYLGIVFIVVVIIPAIVLSFLAIRAISHEEAYIEKQMEGTLSAEVTHVAAVVRSELAEIQAELAGTVAIPTGDDPWVRLEEWRRASPLVDVPFLLSPTYEILWPAAAPPAGEAPQVTRARPAEGEDRPDEGPTEEKQTTFLADQQAFLSDEERTPVYENIAMAYKNEILEDEPVVREIHDVITMAAGRGRDTAATRGLAIEDMEETPAGLPDSAGRAVVAEGYVGRRLSVPGAPAGSEARDEDRMEIEEALEQETARGRAAPRDLAALEAPPAGGPVGRVLSGEGLSEQTRRQSAMSRFVESEAVRKKVYDKAKEEGQEFLYRNVEVAGVESPRYAAEAEETPESERVSDAAPETDREAERVEPPARAAGRDRSEPARYEPGPGAGGRVRSVFISEPLSLSEIVAGGERGIVPRTVDGSLQLLYWERAAEGRIVGCLIDSGEMRERIIGALPGVYSAVRILTVLDELGRPVIVPPGHEERDWRRPFVAEEISEMLPRWEVAAYLSDPDIISSRAQVATSVMWILILILFVSIVGGGVLVARSTFAEIRLAQQKTSFVANVSHELKTPLTSIRMFAEMLRDGRQPDRDKQRQYLDIMTAETERLTRLVNNVLDFSRMERGEKRYTMKAVDLVALASSVVESQRARLEHGGFEVSFNTRTGPVSVHADEEAIKQALVNLLSNAEKYSTQTRNLEVVVTREATSAVVGVSDRGIGVPAAQAKMIFDEFYRVDDTLTSAVKGAGLGLTIARRILRDHGGDIRLKARKGGGSTFEIVLPLAGGEA